MTYKIKSLVYFACFLASAYAYDTIGNDTQVEKEQVSEEIAELKMEGVMLNNTTVNK
jgi:hypothetical protein